MDNEKQPLQDRLNDVAVSQSAKAIRALEAKHGVTPRRIDLNRFTPEEKLIWMATSKVEELGAHPMLTKVVTLLGEARGVLADWIDGERYDPAKFGTVPDRETWWLVERKVQPPQYCVQSFTDMPSLTHDPWRAARFSTEREAFDYRLRLSSLRDECKETEHVFINKR